MDLAPSSDDLPPLPSAPYAAAGVRSAYRPAVPDGSFSPDPGGRSSFAPEPGERVPGPRSGGRSFVTAPPDDGPRPVPEAGGPDPSPPLTGAWPERDPADLLPVSPSAANVARGPTGSAPRSVEGERLEDVGPGPWRDPAEETRASSKPPPSGYTELGPPGPLLERLARRWPPTATLSRRAVLALIALGASAVVVVVFLHDRPSTVSAPEMVTHAASVDRPSIPGSEGGAPRSEESSSSEEPATGESEVVVHVGGEVTDPGLYTLPPGSRVADAVEEAGGALPDADLDVLNLARPLVDGEQVLVGVPPPAGTSETTPQGIAGPVNVNQADRALLETLPGVGPVIADNIIAHREEHGPFGSVDDLIDVNRIGEKMLSTLRPHVTVE